MAKMWYPVIDILECIECGTCVAKCSHGVYDKQKDPVPVVINPDACIDHCHGCGNICPQGAILYAGDDTGWKPPMKENVEINSCCCGSVNVNDKKTVLVEYLYLDLKTCDRCVGTDKVLEEVLEVLTPVLELAGYDVKYHKKEMATINDAKEHKFVSSPTIRVNGNDICDSVIENDCGCCGEISGTQVDCRVFEYEGNQYEVPPKAMLTEYILRAVFSENKKSSCGEYELPDNLKRFYEGKTSKSSCCCNGGCC